MFWLCTASEGEALTFSFTLLYGCLHTHCVNGVGIISLPSSSDTTLDYTVLVQNGAREHTHTPLKLKVSTLSVLASCLKSSNNEALSQNNRKYATVQILAGGTVCAQTCLLAGEAEEGGSDTCMNKRRVRED